MDLVLYLVLCTKFKLKSSTGSLNYLQLCFCTSCCVVGLSGMDNVAALQFIFDNHLYAFFIGNFSIWTSFTGARYFIEYFKAGKVHLRFSDICKLFCIIVQSSVLLSLWVVLNHRIVLVDESWRIKFERVRHNDILKLPGRWMLQEILIPIITNLLMAPCLPYVFARWIVPSLGFSLTVNSTWVAYATIIVLFSCAKRFPVWITYLHNSMRDDRYSCNGLQNFGEAAMECEDQIGKLVRWISES
ncbi:hypothetical protein MKX01_017252 [Papaver californicum]|nr:hypothetical protein MKX01_017252 [Papaver californicum]